MLDKPRVNVQLPPKNLHSLAGLKCGHAWGDVPQMVMLTQSQGHPPNLGYYITLLQEK